MERIVHHLRQSKQILVATHFNPDGDAIGSLIAMALALDALGKDVTLFNESPIPAVYRFLPAVDRIVRQVETVDRYDTAVVLDCGDVSRIGALAPALDRIPTLLNIDHHPTNTGFGDARYVDDTACSTAEILYRIFKRLPVAISQDIATAIYTGILTDTGSFRFANTNRTAFAICVEMMEKGVDPYTVAKHVYGTYSLGRIKLLNLALDSIELLNEGRLSVMTLTRDMMTETGTQPEDVDGMINYAKRIQDVQVAVLIQEINGSGSPGFHVSLRSDGSVDVAALAAHFGGGGHHRAAGFTAEMPLPAVKDGIRNWLARHQAD